MSRREDIERILPVSTAAAAPSSQVTFPCIGRERELAQITDAFAGAVAERRGRTVYLTGEAGIGRSLVTTELARRLGTREVWCFRSACPQATASTSYHALIAVLDELAQALDGAGHAPIAARGREVREALSGKVLDPMTQQGASWELRRLALYERVATFLGDASRVRPLVVVIEDLHLADAAMVALCAHLAQTRADSPGFDAPARGREPMVGLLVLTARGSKTMPAWLDGTDALSIYLDALGPDAVREFLQSADVVAFFSELTGGRPRALEALLDTPALGVDELQQLRTARLGAASRRVLAALTIWGRPVGVDALRRVSRLEDDALSHAVQQLLSERLITRSLDDGELRLWFARAWDAEVHAAVLSAEERRELHSAAGQELAERAPDETLAIAEHLLCAGAGEHAVDAAITAGDRLEVIFAYDRAIGLYTRALEMTLRDDVREILDERLCGLHRATGDFRAALEAADRLRRRHPASAAAHRRIAELHVLSDELALALTELSLAEPLATLARDRVELSQILATRAEIHLLAGRHADAKSACRAASELLDDNDASRERRYQIENTLGKIALAQGAYVEAAEQFAQLVTRARQEGYAPEECRGLVNLGICELRLGEMSRAATKFTSALRVAESIGDVRLRATAHQNLGVLAHWRGDYSTALECFREAALAFRKTGQRARAAWIAFDMASLYLDLNEAPRAAAMAELADRFIGTAITSALDIKRRQVAGRLSLMRGELDVAEAHFVTAEQHASAAGDRERAIAALLEIVRCALERGEVTRARQRLAQALEIPSGRMQGRYLLIAGEIEIAAGMPLDARPLLLRAVEHFQQESDLEGAWRAQLHLGRAARSVDDVAEAQRRFDLAYSIDQRLRESVPPLHAAAHAAHGDRQILARALGLPRVVSIDTARSTDRLVLVPADATMAAPSQPTTFEGICGTHPRMTHVFQLIEKAAPYESLVLIRGESGTGKELVADAIHSRSPRHNRPFIKVNCAALVESLLLSELFGHERGAFTGALQRKKGRFEAADGGTLFLDEIGDISPKTQVALLRVLQEREFERVGGTAAVKVDVRILCATHRNLEQMVARGEFREDLYYRLKGIQIELPALRERSSDIPRLAEGFLREIAAERGRPGCRFAPDAVELLERHAWPGNVRELENVVRSVSLFAEGTTITSADLLAYSAIQPMGGAPGAASERAVASAAAVAAPVARLVPTTPTDPAALAEQAYDQLGTSGLSLKELKTQIEIACIRRALDEADGNITRAAELLGMKRPRLSQLVKEHRIFVKDPLP